MNDKIELDDFDVADHLHDREEMAAYLEACIEESEGDIGFIAKALGDIARAQGMGDIAQEIGVGRASLYKSLSENGNPSFETVFKVAHALGLRLRVAAA